MNARTTAVKGSKPAAPKANAFAGLAGILGKGAGDLMQEGDEFANVPLTDIWTDAQVRTEFSDEENTDAELDASVEKHGVFTPVLLCPTPDGPAPFKLCAGERRYRSSQRTKKETIPALIRKMTPEEFADMQFAENVQRKNLTQIENAKKIQAELDALGSVEAVLAKHNKGRPWLSKLMSLLTLPEQAQRVVSEKISADTEVINKVKTVENIDPAAAKVLVDDLAKNRGKADARQMADAALDKVKPKTPAKAAKKAEKEAKAAKQAAPIGGTVATAADETAKEPGPVEKVFAEAKHQGAENEVAWPFPTRSSNDQSAQPVAASSGPALPPAAALDRAYEAVLKGLTPRKAMELFTEAERTDVQEWLESLYIAGSKAPNMTMGVVQGFRNGTFTTEGSGALALIAFLQGADADVQRFSLLDVIGLAKP